MSTANLPVRHISDFISTSFICFGKTIFYNSCIKYSTVANIFHTTFNILSTHLCVHHAPTRTFPSLTNLFTLSISLSIVFSKRSFCSRCFSARQKSVVKKSTPWFVAASLLQMALPTAKILRGSVDTLDTWSEAGITSGSARQRISATQSST